MPDRRLNLRAIAIFTAVLFLPVVGSFANAASAASVPTATVTPPTCGNDALIALSNPTSAQVEFMLFHSSVSTTTPWDVVFLSANRSTTVHATVAASGETLSVQTPGQTIASSAVKRSSTTCPSGTATLPAITQGKFGATISAPSCGNNAQVDLNDGLSHDIWFVVQVAGGSPDSVVDIQANEIGSVTETFSGSSANVEVVWNGSVIAQKTVTAAAPCAGSTTTTSMANTPASTTTTTSTTVPSSGCAAADNLSGWGGCPKFDDEFNGSSVNTGNNGWFIYNSPSDPSHPRVAANLSESGGTVQLAGTYNKSTGSILGAGMMSKFAEKYGQFEVRAKLPKGAGFSGVSLLWPGSGKWPNDGEIDLYEIPKDPRTQAYQVVHNDPNNDQQGQWANLDATQWHTYEVQWTPKAVTFLIDGNVTWSETNTKLVPSTAPMNITLQMDPGVPCGGWYECPNSSTPASQAMSVDWVKVWSYAS